MTNLEKLLTEKPREWWIELATIEAFEAGRAVKGWVYDYAHSQTVHVIEHAAYDAVVKERDAALAMVEIQASGNALIAALDAVTKERDSLQKEVSRLYAVLVERESDLRSERAEVERLKLKLSQVYCYNYKEHEVRCETLADKPNEGE